MFIVVLLNVKEKWIGYDIDSILLSVYFTMYTTFFYPPFKVLLLSYFVITPVCQKTVLAGVIIRDAHMFGLLQ